MELKYNLIEGNDAASRAILMMKYNLTKTLTENTISEQYTVTLEQTNPLEIPSKITNVIGAPFVLTDYMIRQYMSRFYNWIKTFDTHDWLTVIEISSTVAAAFSGPFAPIFLGIAGIAGAYDAYLYFTVDKDPYMGTIMMALTLLTGGTFKLIFKSSKVLQKRGVEGLINLIKKYKSGGKMTKEQLKDLSTFGIEFAKKSSEVKDAMVRQLSDNTLKYFLKKSLKYITNFLLALSKFGFNLSKTVFYVGGTAFTFDQIYLYVFRDSLFKNEKYLDSRTQNSTRKKIVEMIDFLSKNEEELRTSLTSQTGKAIDKVGLEATKNIKVIDTTEATRKSFLEDSFEKEKNRIESQNTKILPNKPLKSLSNSIAPTLDDVRSGKKVIKKGQKGDSVKEIQKMLYSIGYDEYVSDGGTLTKWDDGNYGESTEIAVIAFQEFEGLNKVDGSVGVETLSKLMEKYDEKNTNNRNK
jgi:hypothetical protein